MEIIDSCSRIVMRPRHRVLSQLISQQQPVVGSVISQCGLEYVHDTESEFDLLNQTHRSTTEPHPVWSR